MSFYWRRLWILDRFLHSFEVLFKFPRLLDILPKGSCLFNRQWLENEEYNRWLQEVKGDNRSAFCNLCKKAFDLRSLGLTAVKKHSTGKKHLELVKASKPAVPLSLFVTSSRPSSSCSSSSPVLIVDESDASASQPSASTSESSNSASLSSASTSGGVTRQSKLKVDGVDALRAEALWVMNAVNTYLSFGSCEDHSKVMKLMFPDSAIARSFGCGESKTGTWPGGW